MEGSAGGWALNGARLPTNGGDDPPEGVQASPARGELDHTPARGSLDRRTLVRLHEGPPCAAQNKVGRVALPITHRTVEVDLHSLGYVAIRSHTTDISVLSELVVSNTYAPLLAVVNHPVRTIVDLGANTGLAARCARAPLPRGATCRARARQRRSVGGQRWFPARCRCHRGSACRGSRSSDDARAVYASATLPAWRWSPRVDSPSSRTRSTRRPTLGGRSTSPTTVSHRVVLLTDCDSRAGARERSLIGAEARSGCSAQIVRPMSASSRKSGEKTSDLVVRNRRSGSVRSGRPPGTPEWLDPAYGNSARRSPATTHSGSYPTGIRSTGSQSGTSGHRAPLAGEPY